MLFLSLDSARILYFNLRQHNLTRMSIHWKQRKSTGKINKDIVWDNWIPKEKLKDYLF